MIFITNPSKILEISAQKNSAAGALAASLAAVFPEVVCQRAQRWIVCGVKQKRSVSAAGEHARVPQALQVVAQSRRRKIDVALDVSRGDALGPCLNHESKDLQANRVPKRTQLLRVAFELRAHPYF
jgi:hypothetical protein